MRILFLGTGGGRFVVINQARATGGIILEMDDQAVHIDPGPGALVRAKEHGFRLGSLTAVAISHCHADHYADAEFIVEAMTNGNTKSGGVLIGSRNVIRGEGDFRPAISSYHLKAVQSHHIMKAGDRLKLGKVEVAATPTSHGEPEGIGFVFRGSKTVGYTSDTTYFTGMEDHFRKCDYLIMNVLRPRGKDWPKHMNTEQAAKLVSLARPGTAIITHFGEAMLKDGPSAEAKYIENETGIRTVAAADGLEISDTGKESGQPIGLGKWAR